MSALRSLSVRSGIEAVEASGIAREPRVGWRAPLFERVEAAE